MFGNKIGFDRIYTLLQAEKEEQAALEAKQQMAAPVKEAGYDATQERTELGATAPAEVTDVSIDVIVWFRLQTDRQRDRHTDTDTHTHTHSVLI